MATAPADKPKTIAFHSLLREWASHDFDEFRRAAEQVSGLLEHPGWAVVERVIGERVAREFSALVATRVADHTAYVAATSEIRGLKAAVEAPRAIVSVFRDESNKAAQRVKLARLNQRES